MLSFLVIPPKKFDVTLLLLNDIQFVSKIIATISMFLKSVLVLVYLFNIEDFWFITNW